MHKISIRKNFVEQRNICIIFVIHVMLKIIKSDVAIEIYGVENSEKNKIDVEKMKVQIQKVEIFLSLIDNSEKIKNILVNRIWL